MSRTTTYKNLYSNTGNLFLKDASTHYIGLASPATSASWNLTLPNSAGSANQLLVNGTTAGVSTWSNPVFLDSMFGVKNVTDPSKLISVDASELTPGVPRTLAMADRNVNLSACSWTGFSSTGGTGNLYSFPTSTTFRLLRPIIGYINGTKITSAAPQTVTIVANVSNYIYIDSTGTLLVSTTETLTQIQDNIAICNVLYDGTVYVVKDERHRFESNVTLEKVLIDSVGAVIRGSGCNIAASATPQAVLVSGGGTYADCDLTMDIPESDPATLTLWYTNALGAWIQYTSATTLPAVYNNAGTVTNLSSNNKRCVYRLYVTDSLGVTSSNTPKFIAVIDTNQYSTLPSATDAINAGLIAIATNELAQLKLAQIGYIVMIWVTGGTITVETTIMQKSSFTTQYTGGSIGSSHLLLADLNGGTYGDGAHTNLMVFSSQTTNPTSDYDSRTYKNGSHLLNTATNEFWYCVDNSLGAAIWHKHQTGYYEISGTSTLTDASWVTKATFSFASNTSKDSCMLIIDACAIDTNPSDTLHTVTVLKTTHVLFYTTTIEVTSVIDESNDADSWQFTNAGSTYTLQMKASSVASHVKDYTVSAKVQPVRGTSPIVTVV